MRQVVLRFVLLLTAALAAPAFARGQDAAEESYSRVRNFLIPFTAGPGKERLREVRLLASTDRGLSWQQIDQQFPNATKFTCRTSQDGVYWFTVQTIDGNGQANPAAPAPRDVSLRVIVDTQAPSVRLTPLTPLNGQVGVSWDIRDENIDPRPEALHLEYRVQNGTGPWQLVRITAPVPQIYWTPETAEPLEVRLKASDKAGNIGESSTVVSLNGPVGGGVVGGTSNQVPRPSFQQAPIEVKRKLVNKKVVTVQYQVDQVGKSGLSAIDVWVVKYGGVWQKVDAATVKNPEPKTSIPLEFPEEGLYGITLVAKSGVGKSEPAPRQGDAPQMWVEIDLTPPVVDSVDVRVLDGAQKGKVAIYWRAIDKNLKQKRPITLSYAEKREGPWIPIDPQPELNASPFLWTVPQEAPSQFFIRVEAADKAGNVGQAVTPNPVLVDLVVPRARVVQIDGN